jgi:hypothetical protein
MLTIATCDKWSSVAAATTKTVKAVTASISLVLLILNRKSI